MTIAQQLKVKDFPFEIKDIKGKLIYTESSKGYWYKYEYDAKGNRIYYEDSNGFWIKYEYDAKGNLIYFEVSKGYWEKREFDANGNEIYYESSKGEIIDTRPKVTLTMLEIAAKFGISVDKLQIKK